jgi:PAS domain S-box-containing protein
LRLINDNTDTAIFAWDMERRRTYINPAIEKLTGYTVQEIAEQPASLWIHPDDIVPMGLVWERAFAGHTYAGDYRVITKTGQLKWCHAEGGPIYDETGQQIGVQASVRDITERKQAEAALRESEERFKALVQHAVDLTTIVDAAGVIRYISPAVERIGGYHVDELVGVRMADLVHPDDLVSMLQKHQERLDQPGVPVLGVARFRHRDGSWRYLEGYGTNYLDNPAIRGIVFNSRDVTEQKQTEAELAMRAEELARSNEELQRFAYVASHDLQEPLRMVASYTQLLQRRYADKLDADANEFIEYAVDGARRMQQLIRDLLEYSRVGTRAKEPRPVDAAAALDDALANLHIALAESGAEIRRGPLPVVLADASQLTQVFQNLIGNAIKFRGTAAPRIEVGAVRAGDAWRFFVADNGIGIDPQHAERIFVIFQRLHTREEYPGTGIGLAICKKIVERHGGRIWVESRLGAGATFNFTLPVHGADGYADERERQAG